MEERAGGVSGGFSWTALQKIAERDAARQEFLLAKKDRTRRRRGNKGSRAWGYRTGGTR